MANQTEETKKTTPPYLGVAKLEKVFQTISSRNYTELTVPLIMGYGLNKIDAQLAFSMLRFLGFINDDGKATELMTKLRLNGDAKKEAFEKIVKDAYQKLFAIVSEPQNLSNPELLQEFRIQYDLSERVAKAAIPAFIKLAEFAGLKEEGSIRGRKREPKAKTDESTAKEKQPAHTDHKSKNQAEPISSPDLFPIKIVDGKFILSVPSDFQNQLNFDDELNAKFRKAIKDIKIIADSYLPKETSAKPPEETPA